MEENPYDYFVGKPVTIVTVGSSLRFTPENHLNYSVGILLFVDEWTCVSIHPVTGKKSLFRLEHVVSIHEEQEIDPENPSDMEMLRNQEERRKEFNKNNPNLFRTQTQPAEPTVQHPPEVLAPMPAAKVRECHSQFVDLESLNDLSKMSKKGNKK